MSRWWDRVARHECGRCGKPNPYWEWVNICPDCLQERARRDMEHVRFTLQFMTVAGLLLAAGLVTALILWISGALP